MIRFLAVLLLAAGAAPAMAAPLGPVASCVYERIPVAERNALGAAMGSDDPFPAALDNSFEAHLTACGGRLSASRADIEGASAEVLSTLYLDTLRPLLRAAGIAPEALDAWFNGQSEEIRATYGWPGMSEAQGRAITDNMMETLAARGIPPSLVQRHSALVSGYLTASVMLFRAQHGLATRIDAAG